MELVNVSCVSMLSARPWVWFGMHMVYEGLVVVGFMLPDIARARAFLSLERLSDIEQFSKMVSRIYLWHAEQNNPGTPN